DELRRCLRSLANARCVGTVWVGDTGSHDGSLEMVHQLFPGVHTHAMPDNPGYGAAANQLIARCSSGVVVLLNADIRVDPGTIETLTGHLAAHPDVAIAGPRLIGLDGAPQASHFADPNLAVLVWRESGLARRRDIARRHRADGGDNSGPAVNVPWV